MIPNRIFTTGLGDQGLIPGRVIPKTKNMVLDASLFNTQHYKVWIKGKQNNPEKGVVLSPTPHCSSYWKVSLQVQKYCEQSNVLKVFCDVLWLKFLIEWCFMVGCTSSSRLGLRKKVDMTQELFCMIEETANILKIGKLSVKIHLHQKELITLFGWFLCLMAYQPLLVI